MITVNEQALEYISGAGAWDDFWRIVGDAIGSALAEDA